MVILGHRGYSGAYPENTMLSFQKALEYKADGVELDVHLSKDGKMVVCHDEDMYRTYGKHAWIKDETLNEMREYESMGQKIPTLQEVFEILPTSAIIDVELKTNVIHYEGLEKGVLDLINANNPERVWISSFNHSSLVKIREMDKNIKLGMLFGEEHLKSLNESMKLSLKIGVFSYNVPTYAAGVEGFDEFLAFAKANGIKIVFWDSNTVEDFDFARKSGAYAVITNEVERAVNFFKGESNR
ncbi:glycerophosphodiester phosphodiesterase family protein [Mesoaciditoga lauensis]|uniref:glycerophosphodiester phosphodiesterase family protein n=1 Tax=Mesoaciditoga lauensis TaxID=1495039 RepID=UPI000690C5B9|nr:glycerophosphodiester phosphodiesterase family protein [Mesoaciditoga lauensis]